MAMPPTPPGVSPTGTLITVNPRHMAVDIQTLDDGTEQWWLVFFSDSTGYKFGPHTREQWNAVIAVMTDPEAAAEIAAARAKIHLPTDGKQAMQ